MPIKFFEDLLSPIVSVIEHTSRLLIGILIGKKRKRLPFVTKEEIKSMIKEIQSQGVLDRGEKEAIEDVFDLRQTKIKDVLTPVRKIVGVDYSENHDAVLRKARRYRFTRFPAFRRRG